ncbi:NINE protein [Nostoc sp. FACHB-152]|uniref:NINE protein n=1 Tax=unclassified Nostoc TaxID=2593658 RepID=UPI001688A4DF|nr:MULTISPECIES: NINE protein [unclassified Nostoc]MBD2447614.1 NINE protein [Nostoc sp. FACHB-152]MBD2470605.1 NINE protein [Nostoc sp. FACHB-145]
MKTKTTAILLCFFGGGIGIHKFYLGQNVAGILYLLFCWTLIPAIIAFVELFILICMKDEDFDTKFNQGRSSTGGSVKDTTSALADLKNLYDSGVITAEEYEEKRQKLLKNI